MTGDKILATAFITHQDCHLHEMGSLHPESPARLVAIEDALSEGSRLIDLLRHYEAPLGDREHILAVHSRDYLEKIERMSPQTGLVYIDPDTAMNPYSLNAAYRSVGAMTLAVDLVMKKEVNNAFCSVRPPGHHAEHNEAMGFCIFNNVAIAAQYSMDHYGLDRVAILDFDVHHGNGTEDIFKNDPRVLFCSTFQHPFFPYKQFSVDRFHLVNVPIAKGCTSDKFRSHVEPLWDKALESFKPQMIFVSAGFDGHSLDYLGQFELLDVDYSWITKKITSWAQLYCEGRIVSTLEGGYNLEVFGKSVAAHIKALMDI